MGQFKPMVKMATTEPSVVLKLKKGGSVFGHKPMKKMDGGVMDALAASRSDQRVPPRVTAGAPMAGAAPARPGLAARRRAMMAKRGMAAPVMAKKGGEVESSKMHAEEMKELKGVKKELKSHEAKPASKAHKGLKGGGGVKMGPAGYKNGGVIKSTKGETIMHTAKRDNSPAQTGGVRNGNAGGYKKGGKVMCKADGGAMRYVEGNVVGTPPGKTNTSTGGVRKGNAGGYKKGGVAKKFARGGQVLQDDGRPEKMPQGKKRPTAPVSISQLSGTFKKGGKVTKKADGGGMVSNVERDLVSERERKGYEDHYKREAAENRAMREAMNPMNWLRSARDALKKFGEGSVSNIERGLNNKTTEGSGSVSDVERKLTITPPRNQKRGGVAKKRYGVSC